MTEAQDDRCEVCDGLHSDEGNEMLLCQGPDCNNGYHLQCLNPPLRGVPDGAWLCPVCTASGEIGIPVSILNHSGNGIGRLYQVRWDSGEVTSVPRENLMGLPILQQYEDSIERVDIRSNPGAGRAGAMKLPPGWIMVSNQAPSAVIKTYFSPDRKVRARSVVEAWRLHNRACADLGTKTKGGLEATPRVRRIASVVRKAALGEELVHESAAARPARAHTRPAPQPSAPPNPPSAPSRKRLIRLPAPEDDKVGKRLKVAISDQEQGNRWFTAKILEAQPCLSNFSNSKVEYLIQFDFDLQKLTVDLADLPFEWMRDDEEPDDCKFQAQPSPPRSREHNHDKEVVEIPAIERRRRALTSAAPSTTSAAPATCTQASQTDAFLLGTDATLRSDPVSRLVADVLESVLAKARDRALSAADDLPIMRPLRSIEWFAGSARLTFALRRNHGWDQAVIHDYDSSKVEWELHDSRPEKDTFRCDEFLEEVSLRSFALEPCYDYFHFSIDCSSFSGLGWAGQSRNSSNDFLGAGVNNMASCSRGNRMVQKTIDLIAAQLERNPHFLFTIENPFTGRLKDHPMIRARLEAPREHGGLGAARVVVDYCWFHERHNSTCRAFKKRTIFWTNSPTIIREFGVHTPPASSSHYLCGRGNPCPCFDSHRPVTSATAAEATPFPRLLAEKIARCISLDATSQRWRPVRL